MIAQLQGTVLLRDDPYLIIGVQGVGYKVLATTGVLANAHVGDTVTVFTYTHVREDALELYGFATYNDLKLFEYLISVSGIGPKTAIGVFSLGSSSDIISAIATGNVAFFSSVPRLGKKNAQKIIIELKNKIGGNAELPLVGVEKGAGDIIQALTSFGYSAKEAGMAIASLKGEGSTTEEKVRLALKYLGKMSF